MKQCYLLHINQNLAEYFKTHLFCFVLAFGWNENLRDIISTKLIEKGKTKRKFTNKIQSTPCLDNNRILCCKHVIHTRTFRSTQTNRLFQTYHNLNFKSYLLEWTKCKIPYDGKAETKFNIRLDNHQKNVLKPDTTPASHHF